MNKFDDEIHNDRHHYIIKPSNLITEDRLKESKNDKINKWKIGHFLQQIKPPVKLVNIGSLPKA
jgi:hypothetical protein